MDDDVLSLKIDPSNNYFEEIAEDEDESVFEMVETKKEEPKQAHTRAFNFPIKNTFFSPNISSIENKNCNNDELINIRMDGNNGDEYRGVRMNYTHEMGFEVDQAETITEKEEMSESEMVKQENGSIQKQVEDNISQNVNRSMEKLDLNNFSIAIKKLVSQAVHSGIICCECGANPIIGVRFKSLIEKNYDICERCEAISDKNHVFIKFRQPQSTIIKETDIEQHWEEYSKLFRNQGSISNTKNSDKNDSSITGGVKEDSLEMDTSNLEMKSFDNIESYLKSRNENNIGCSIESPQFKKKGLDHIKKPRNIQKLFNMTKAFKKPNNSQIIERLTPKEDKKVNSILKVFPQLKEKQLLKFIIDEGYLYSNDDDLYLEIMRVFL